MGSLVTSTPAKMDAVSEMPGRRSASSAQTLTSTRGHIHAHARGARVSASVCVRVCVCARARARARLFVCACTRARRHAARTHQRELAQAGMFSLAAGEVHDAEAVRARMHDLIRWAEMKWRYRVVEKGQHPRDEALKVLRCAQGLLDAHRAHVGSTADAFAKQWAEEQSAVFQGLGVTMLIFDAGDLSGEAGGEANGVAAEIERLLEEARRDSIGTRRGRRNRARPSQVVRRPAAASDDKWDDAADDAVSQLSSDWL